MADQSRAISTALPAFEVTEDARSTRHPPATRPEEGRAIQQQHKGRQIFAIERWTDPRPHIDDLDFQA